MKQTLTRGFTLIELLVVIAIIGILASVVLASLNSAREKGADASASSSLNNARAQAELYYSSPASGADNSYDGVCAATPANNGISANIAAADDATSAAVTAVCGDNASQWGASVELSNGEFYCVDSTGFGGPVTPDPAITDADPLCN